MPLRGRPKMADDPQQWQDIMTDEVAWKTLVNRMHYTESSCDRVAPSMPAGRALLFTCDTCKASFASSKALCSHRRTKHGHRLAIKDFLATAVCPCCKCDYRQRLRLIAHVSESRRPNCRDWILQHCTPLDTPALHPSSRSHHQETRQGRHHTEARGPAQR